MAFHDLSKNLKELKRAFLQQYPDQKSFFTALSNAIQNDLNLPHAAIIHDRSYESRMISALCILMSASWEEAVQKKTNMGIETESARTALRTVLTTVGVMKGEAYMVKIGAIRLPNGQYCPAKEEEISAILNARQHIAQAHTPILDCAILLYYEPRQRDIIKVGPTAFPYVLAQLMPPGDEKDFRLNALSQQTRIREPKKFLESMAKIVQAIAQEKGIILPEGYLITTEKPSSQSSSSNALRAGFPHNLAVPVTEEKEVHHDLLKKLKDLADAQEITKNQGLVYFMIHHPDPSKMMGENAAMKKYGISQEDMNILINHVEACLQALELEEQGKIVEFPKNPQPKMVIIRGSVVKRSEALTDRSG